MFKDILGQEHLKSVFINKIKEDTLSHSHLILGEDGLGRLELAKEIVKAMFCENKTGDACNNCSNCKKIINDNHEDVFTIIKDTIKIEDIRELEKEISIKPYNSKHKIYIIENGHNMTKQAENALLKTLEEPPEYIKIFILGEDKSYFLPTIISRCQIWSMNKVDKKIIESFLIDEYSIDKKRAEEISLICDGNIKRAEILLNSEDLISKRRAIIDIIFTHTLKNIRIFKGEFLLDEKDNIESLLDIFLSIYRDTLVFKTTNAKELILNEDIIDDIIDSKLSKEELLINIEVIKKTMNYLKGNTNYKLTIESMLINLK